MLNLLLIPLGASLALLTYLRLEPRGRRTWIPMAARAVAWGGLGALLANPGCPGSVDTRPPVVLLDASLSMTASPDAVAHRLGFGAPARAGAVVRRRPAVDRFDSRPGPQ